MTLNNLLKIFYHLGKKIYKKNDPENEQQNIWEQQLIKEDAARKEATSNTPSKTTPSPNEPQQNYDWNSHLLTFQYEYRHQTPCIKSPV